MPFVLMEGWEDVGQRYGLPATDTTGWTSTTGAVGTGLALRRSGAGSSTIYTTALSAPTTVCVGMSVYVATGAGGVASFMEIDLTLSRWFSWEVSTSGGLSMKNSGITGMPTVNEQLELDTWHNIQIRATVNGSGYDLWLYVNGVGVVGGGTVGASSATVEQIDFRPGGDSLTYYDDYWIWADTGAPTGFPFRRPYIERLLPDATGALTDWGGAYTDVDDADPEASTGTSVSSTTSGHRASYSMTAPATTPETVIAVQYDLYGEGTANVSALWRSSGGSVGVDTASLAVPVSFGYIGDGILDANPQTATAWTPSDLTSGEFGFELD